MVAALGLKDRVRLRLEDDHVEIWPDVPPHDPPPTRPPVRPRPARGPVRDGDRRVARGDGSPRSAAAADPPARSTSSATTRPATRSSTPCAASASPPIRAGSSRSAAARAAARRPCLNILGGLDQPTSGRVIIDGHEVSAMTEDELVDVRRRSVAFIFQVLRARADPVGGPRTSRSRSGS
jgi:hypothetical protein